jgi:general secretion pathway protein K
MNVRPMKLDQNGSALVVTLLIITVLISLAVEFAYEVYIDSSLLSNWSNAQMASLTARSGQTIGASFIKDLNKLAYTYPGEIYLPVEKDFGPDTSLVVRIEDENAKFNINSIVRDDGKTEETALSNLQKLLEYLNINPDIADAIADWTDSDHIPRKGLRNSEDNAKNAPLWSIEELKLIKGVNEEVFEKVSPFLTAHGDWGKINDININTARLPVLISLLDISEELAQRIIDYRESSPFKEIIDIKNVSGVNENLFLSLQGRFITVKSSMLKTISKAKVDEITRVIESVTDTSTKVRYWREG